MAGHPADRSQRTPRGAVLAVGRRASGVRRQADSSRERRTAHRSPGTPGAGGGPGDAAAARGPIRSAIRRASCVRVRAVSARLRPLPWRRMAWVTWRQHRFALGGVTVLLGALAVYLWLTGLQIHHSYASVCHPVGTLACAMNFTGRYGITGIFVSVILQAVPPMIGAFAGAPVLARELETGTFRYAWT